MQQHPVPQNVITFEDRLFGDFTIRQFIILAVGAAMCFALYMSPLPTALKYFLMVFFGVTCAALALVKLNGTYLDVWLKDLVVALFGPTQFIWRKEELLPSVLTEITIPLSSHRASHGEDRITPDFSSYFPDEIGGLEPEEREYIGKLNFDLPITAGIIAATNDNVVMPKKQEDVPRWEQKIALATNTSEQRIPDLTQTLLRPDQQGPSPAPLDDSNKPSTSQSLPDENPEKKKEEPSPSDSDTLIMPAQKPLSEPAVPSQMLPIQPQEAPEEPFNLPLRQQMKIQSSDVITPLASEINFSLKPVFTFSMAGKEAHYVSGLTNLRVNRTIKNIYHAKTKTETIRGEKEIVPSEAIKERFNALDRKLEALEAQRELGIIDEFAGDENATAIHTASEIRTTPSALADQPPTPEPIPAVITSQPSTPKPDMLPIEIKPPTRDATVTLPSAPSGNSAPAEMQKTVAAVPADAAPLVHMPDALMPAMPPASETPRPVDIEAIAQSLEKMVPQHVSVTIGPEEKAANKDVVVSEPEPTSVKEASSGVQPRIITEKTIVSKSPDIGMSLKGLFGKKATPQNSMPTASLSADSGFMKVTIPNLVEGSVKDAQGNRVEEVIVIVKDFKGVPVRALKTNHLGQFITATSLPNGKYQIEFEKEGLKFDIINFELVGQIFPPIEISAKG